MDRIRFLGSDLEQLTDVASRIDQSNLRIRIGGTASELSIFLFWSSSSRNCDHPGSMQSEAGQDSSRSSSREGSEKATIEEGSLYYKHKLSVRSPLPLYMHFPDFPDPEDVHFRFIKSCTYKTVVGLVVRLFQVLHALHPCFKHASPGGRG
ncbi:uncharacterized protein RAG0_11326 [Rhynchosporium agropyri]|uniref:Uncharacterized protein n=1 Tax=Rhynchosporium agropyri TaxID=914238 RepID=A0A1E1L3S5_9HELO|nr:uncharacterized protein RAG0_11326 [Rhynchosporium agropyri]